MARDWSSDVCSSDLIAESFTILVYGTDTPSPH
jgi:hypothetical protein